MSERNPVDPRVTQRLPPLSPALRELVETLWAHAGPLTTRQLQDATARRYPHRAGRRITTTSTLLESLVEVGWVARDKRGGGRWRWRAAVSRHEGMQRLASIAVEELSADPRDGWYLVEAALPGALLERVRRTEHRPAACVLNRRRQGWRPDRTADGGRGGQSGDSGAAG